MTTIDLHFICQHHKNWAKLDADRFESGNWVVGEKIANQAIGGRIYLHEKQDEPAWHGGTIVDWRPSNGTSRKVFSYRLDGNFRIRCTTGWGREKAIVRR